MPYQLQFADWVPVPVSEVFAFFADPENLPRLMPPQLQTKVDGFQLVAPPPPPSQNLNPIEVHHVAGAGSIIDTSLRRSVGSPGAASGPPPLPNSNGTITSPTCSRKVHSNDGIIVTNFQRTIAMVSTARSCAMSLNTKLDLAH
jgi:hypothetical protein